MPPWAQKYHISHRCQHGPQRPRVLHNKEVTQSKRSEVVRILNSNWLHYQLQCRKQGGKLDPLSKRSEELSEQWNEELAHQSQTVLKKENLAAQVSMFAGSLRNEPVELDSPLKSAIRMDTMLTPFPTKYSKCLKIEYNSWKKYWSGNAVTTTTGSANIGEVLYPRSRHPWAGHHPDLLWGVRSRRALPRIGLSTHLPPLLLGQNGGIHRPIYKVLLLLLSC